MKHLSLILILSLTACQHAAGTLGECYDGAFNSFCVVNTPPGTTVTTGTAIVPAVGTVLGGVGSMMLGEGSIVGGVAAVVRP